VIEVAADGTLAIIDMGSVEGTYVNGKRVNKGVVAFGDEIKVGNTTIKVEQGTAQPAAGLEQKTAVVNVDPSLLSTNPGLAQASPETSQPVTDSSPVPEPAAAPAPAPSPEGGRNGAGKALDPSFASTAQNPRAAPKAEAAAAGRARPARRKGSGPMGLEVRLMWGDQNVGEYFLRPGEKPTFTVGSAKGVDFPMGDSKLGGSTFQLVKGDPGGFLVRFSGKMNGELERGGDVMELKQVIETRKASHDGDAYAISMESEDFVWVDLGGVVAECFFQPIPKAVFAPLVETIDFTALNIFLVMFFVGALFVITALNRDAEGSDLADDLSGSQARIAKLIVKPPEVEKNKFLQELNKQKEDQGEMAAKHRGDEGQMGKKDAPKRSAHAAPKGDPNNKDQARILAAKIFGSGGSGISTIFGHNGLGGELKSAMGNMFGAAAGDAQGFGGLGLRGSGAGGGGVGDTIGIGGIGTKGRGGGTGTYGTGVGVLGGKKSVDIGITSSEPTVMGSLDKELIRQVIHRNRNQIRYCYESQLTRFPKLHGKVAVKFVISAQGTVASSNVAQSDVGNAELETCVAGRVRTWQFPKPKGGGIVIVTYPFVFTQSGG
jgi:TonB family protein